MIKLQIENISKEREDEFKRRNLVDTQYLSGTRDTIRENLCLVVDHACRIGFFDPYISRLDHILAQQHSENSYSYDVPQTMSQEGVYHV